MAISTDEVSKIAKLARLSFTEEEKQKFTTELSAILNYADQLKQIENQVMEEVHDPGALNLMRDDVAIETTPAEDLLQQAPAREGNFIKVKSILE
jgi:aspartyl-tRNA(Asn)/glutamyl-tRNA(Gln) amidotransferase subunit C